ncbi:MAG: hypothetical protein WC792_04070 [Candidatus Micrarchaeia archaeon]|jgi:hypothetical protein
MDFPSLRAPAAPLFLLAFFLLLLSPIAFALSPEGEVSPPMDSGAPGFAGIPIDAQTMQKLSALLGSTGLSGDALASKTLVIRGAGVDISESVLFDQAMQRYGLSAKAERVSDSDEAFGRLESGNYALVVLVGGPSQNKITKRLQASGVFNDSGMLFPPFSVLSGKQNGVAVIAFTDAKGLRDQPRPSAQYSPLSAVMPQEYVPLAATLLSWLAFAAIYMAKGFFSKKISEFGKKGKKFGEGVKVMLWGVNFSEPAALLAASMVLGLSLSWQFIGPTPEFFGWVLLNTAICFATSTAHESVTRIFAHAFKIPAEYRFWARGSALTLVSTWLGNAFSLQGFLLEQIPPHVEKWKIGLMKLSAPLSGMAVVVAFALYNSVHPDQVFQTVYTSSAIYSFMSLQPFSSTASEIRKWSKGAWLASFAVVAACYACITFIL